MSIYISVCLHKSSSPKRFSFIIHSPFSSAAFSTISSLCSSSSSTASRLFFTFHNHSHYWNPQSSMTSLRFSFRQHSHTAVAHRRAPARFGMQLITSRTGSPTSRQYCRLSSMHYTGEDPSCHLTFPVMKSHFLTGVPTASHLETQCPLLSSF